MTITHHPITDHYPGSHGEYPEPAETTVSCACGAELWEWQEGYTCSPGSPEDAFAEHLTEVGA